MPGLRSAAVVTSALLAATVVGALLIPLLWPAYLALLLFGLPVAAYFLGRRAVLSTGRHRPGDVLTVTVGAVLVAIVSWIPFLGGLVVAALALLGAGACMSALLARRRQDTPRATYENSPGDRRDR